MGDTGNATGVHLTIKHKNKIIDPLPFLQGKDFSGEETKYVFNDLPKNTIVAYVKKDGWVKISDLKNRLVSSIFLE